MWVGVGLGALGGWMGRDVWYIFCFTQLLQTGPMTFFYEILLKK